MTSTQATAAEDRDIVTTAQAAKLLGISVRTAQLLIEGGALTSWKTPGGHRRVRRADVLALMTKTNEAPAFSSALVIVVASSRNLQRYRKTLAEIGEAAIDSYSDPYAALFAVGSRLPAGVVIDVEDGDAERLALLHSLAANPALGNTRIIAVGAKTVPGAETLPYVIVPKLRADTVRTLLRDKSDLTTLVESNLSFPIAANENQRLAALDRSGLLDTAPEKSFDRLTWLASHAVDAPIALLTMLTPTRQWFKSHHGLDMTETPRSWAFCNYTILKKELFAVKDLAADKRFANNPAVAGGPRFRFYAGAPVVDDDGFTLGSLCVIDYKPRTLDKTQSESLLALASLASDEIRLRATNKQLRWALEELNRQRAVTAK